MNAQEFAVRVLVTSESEPLASVSKLLIQKYQKRYSGLMKETLFTNRVLQLEKHINREVPSIIMIGEGVDGFKNIATCASYLKPRYPLARLIGFGGAMSEEEAHEYEKYLMAFILLSSAGTSVVDLLAPSSIKDLSRQSISNAQIPYCTIFEFPMKQASV